MALKARREQLDVEFNSICNVTICETDTSYTVTCTGFAVNNFDAARASAKLAAHADDPVTGFINYALDIEGSRFMKKDSDVRTTYEIKKSN